jgi:type I restriction-modification system DNA methylase subunit
MSLFQNSVLNKYLKGIDSQKAEQAWNTFKTHFHNPEIQENIRNSKEEQYQGEFLIDLFVNVFGYVKNPSPKFNLTTELKNIKGAKKTDGAIIQEDKAIAVIELKGTNTVDLAKVETQAFGYKNNQPGCKYVITSNFEKLRLYIDNAVEFEEFFLFNLSRERFDILYLCLSEENLLKGIPKQIKDESLTREEAVTKKLYKDYSKFRNEIFDNIQKQNEEYDKLTLFKKTQKLLDRFLFIFFAEDRLLLPPNSIREIVTQWTDLRDKYDEYQPLYDRFKKYFGYMNTGYEGKKYEIFAYNGGLFAPDEILDSISIDDDLLYKHTVNLSNYDFESEVSVNILGHIFEHSLTEIESIQAQLEGIEIEKSKTKRKKDGVFYTPKYITKYIVDNTIGRLCQEKKNDLSIDESDYDKERKGRKKATVKKLSDQLDSYRNWLLELTICDPACGSGAFLNQALEFLIEEHHYIDELKAKLLGDAMIFSEVQNDILEKNLFGVDINQESVEIAKLSLWLRTAKKGRKLTTLNDNIKCGNSLISDSNAAGNRAFDWEKEFSSVFKDGGFDVVIGNPPYLRVQGLRENFEEESKFYEKSFISATGRFDIYVLFIEMAHKLIKKEGNVSFILPHKFLVSDFGEGIRKYLAENKAVKELIHFGSEMVFEDASTYTCILTIGNHNENIHFKEIKPSQIFDPIPFDVSSYENLNGEKWNLKSEKAEKLFSKLYSNSLTVKDVFENISQGIVSVGDDIFLLKGSVSGDKFIGYSEKIQEKIELEAAIVKPLLKGEDVKKYLPLRNSYYCLYPHKEENGKTIPLKEKEFLNGFPQAYNYILPFKEELIEKKIRYKTNPTAWYSLHRSREMSLFEQAKIITPEISLGTNMTLDSNNLYHNTKCYSLTKSKEYNIDLRALLAILNSKVLWYFLKNTGYVLRGGFFTFKTKYLEPFPLPSVENILNETSLIDKVDIVLEDSITLDNQQSKYLDYIKSQYHFEKISKKMREWYNLEYGEFLKELKKIIKKSKGEKLTKADEMEWMDLFETKKEEAQMTRQRIDKTNNELNQLVYELYGFTKDEIDTIEEANA